MILAIDPSAADCGYAVLTGTRRQPRIITSGTWHPSKAKGAAAPIEQLAEFVSGLAAIDLAIADAAVEVPDGGERFRPDGRGGRVQLGGSSERTYAQAVGACRAAAALSGAVVWPVPVSRWKGRATKEATIAAVVHATGHQPKDHNEADAIGLALWWLSELESRARDDVKAFRAHLPALTETRAQATRRYRRAGRGFRAADFGGGKGAGRAEG